jgi:hypothetical protein
MSRQSLGLLSIFTQIMDCDPDSDLTQGEFTNPHLRFLTPEQRNAEIRRRYGKSLFLFGMTPPPLPPVQQPPLAHLPLPPAPVASLPLKPIHNQGAAAVRTNQAGPIYNHGPVPDPAAGVQTPQRSGRENRRGSTPPCMLKILFRILISDPPTKP